MTPEFTPDVARSPQFGASACSTFFLSGWKRKWAKTTNNNPNIKKVFVRNLVAEDRYQQIHKFGRYATADMVLTRAKNNLMDRAEIAVAHKLGEDILSNA